MMTTDDIVKMHLGNLMVQIISLQADNERLRAEIETLRPDKNSIQKNSVSCGEPGYSSKAPNKHHTVFSKDDLETP